MALKVDEIKKALIKSKGLISPAARSLGVARQTLYRRIKNNKSLKKTVNSEREELKDFTESILLKLIKKEDFRAVKYFLSTQAKDRGYIERLQTEEVGEQKKQVFKIGETVIEFGKNK